MPNISMNQPCIYIRPLPLEPPSHLSPHPTPQGCHRTSDLSSLCHAPNFHRQSNFMCDNLYVSMLLSQKLPHVECLFSLHKGCFLGCYRDSSELGSSTQTAPSGHTAPPVPRCAHCLPRPQPACPVMLPGSSLLLHTRPIGLSDFPPKHTFRDKLLKMQ